MEVKKILWPTDFSSNAEAAQPYVESLSDLYQTEVHVLYVIPELADHEPWYGIFEKSHIDRIHEWEKENATQRLDEICKNYLEGCPLYLKHTAIGNPAEEILKMIEKEDIDLVVMASHGKQGHFDFGSVTEKVVKNSPKPVVTIPIDDRES